MAPGLALNVTVIIPSPGTTVTILAALVNDTMLATTAVADVTPGVVNACDVEPPAHAVDTPPTNGPAIVINVVKSPVDGDRG